MKINELEFFGEMNLSENSAELTLDNLTDRIHCPKCGKKRLYFCYDCLVNLLPVDYLAPKLKLPVQIHIIKHPQEHNSKSTAIHCALLAPDDTKIYNSKVKKLPNFFDSKEFPNIVLVYPGKNSISITEFVKNNGPIKHLVVLDATWFTVKGIKKRTELNGIPIVALKTYKTEYWRPQKGFSDEYLATIEAIRFAIKENAEASGENVNEDYLKDLLFWFHFFRAKVHPSLLIKNC